MRKIVFAVFLGLCLQTVNLQLVCYQCEDCEFQQEIPVVCGDIDYTTTTNPTDTTCPTCAPEPTLPTTPEWTTSTPETTCPTCAPPPVTTPIPTTSTPDTTCPTCAPTLPTSPIPTTSTPAPTSVPTTSTPETTCPTCAPPPPTTPIPTTSTPDTTCPTCAPTLPTSPIPTTSTPAPTPTTPIPTQPPPTLPTSPSPTTSTPAPTTQPYCPPGCCPCSTARSTSIFALAARAAKSAMMDEFEDEIRSPRQLPLPVYVCFTTERYVSNRRVISRGCTKRRQTLGETCEQVNGGQTYEQCSLCSWQLCNR